ncbi:chorismate mutase [Micromonospora sp. NPDC051925]|uniref:chorismate mutase n=1 Tax=Micromonospora sp. NPDC051925 TaxID=3364288 RepID=UPI0037C96629
MDSPDTATGATTAVDAGAVLAPLRGQLDEIDREILALIVRRMRVCLDVARLKSEHTIPMMQQSRVSQVVGRARAYAAEHGLSEDYLGDLYTRIIAETCAEEDRLISELTREARP